MVSGQRRTDARQRLSELRLALGSCQLLAAVLQRHFDRVQLGVDSRDVVDDLRRLRGVLDLEVCRAVQNRDRDGRR